MRTRALALAMAAVAAAAPAGAVAAFPAKPRMQTLEYVAGGVTAGPRRTVMLKGSDNVGAVVFRGGPERYVSVEIDDRHGLPVTGIVSQEGAEPVYVCGASDEPVRVKPFETVTVYVMNGVCGEGGVSVATAGTVTATFTRR